MARKIMTSILAAAVAITSISAVPAQAGNRELGRAIVGITALAIIGTAIANESRAQTSTRHQTYEPPKQNTHKAHKKHHYNQGHHYHKPKHKKRALPGYCRVNYKGKNGWKTGYGVRCTKNNVRRPAALPSDCIRRNYANGPRLVYAARCMRKNGYSA